MKRAPFPPAGSVLLLVDLQNAIDHPSWGTRNNPLAEADIQRLLDRWRTQGWPVWHVRHDSTDPKSHYRPGQQGNEFKPAVAPLVSEPVIPKRTNSAFIGTDLEARLRAGGHQVLVVAGVITNNSVEATVRMAGNLEFATYLVADGCFTFDRTDWNGTPLSAEDVHAMSLANLDGKYCTCYQHSPAARPTELEQVYVLWFTPNQNLRADVFDQRQGRHFRSVTRGIRIREGPFGMEGAYR
jgi:nicotinamidase-related amidase